MATAAVPWRGTGDVIAACGLAVSVLALFAANPLGIPRLMLPVALWGIAAAVAILSWAKVRIPRIAAGVAAGGLAILGLVVLAAPTTVVEAEVVASPSPSPSPSPSASPYPSPSQFPPPEPPPIEFLTPRREQASVQGCFRMEFLGRAPAGWTFIASNRHEDDTTTFFEGETKSEDGQHWHAHTSIGQGDPTAIGDLYHLTVWLVRADVAAYLLASHRVEDNTYWQSTDPPPEARPAASMTIRRAAANGRC